MPVFYNEIDAYPAQWMRNLIKAGHIANGTVVERSVVEIRAEELEGFNQAHFFAGIGVWSHALRLAGWPDDREVWTGSCPCQPFSQAGLGGGFSDPRHLWPNWFKLIAERRPAVVLGEQVASPDGLRWLDAVRADLEGAGYAFGAFDLSAAGIGAPHIRQRLYFAGVRLADHHHPGLGQLGGSGVQGHGDAPQRDDVDGRGALGGLGHHHHQGLERRRLSAERASERFAGKTGLGRFWRNADWIECADGVWRPVEPGTFPLAHGAPSRVGRLRAYGNAIVAPLAATFAQAVREAVDNFELRGFFEVA